MEINGIKVNINPNENLRVTTAEINLGAMDFSGQFIRSLKRWAEKNGNPGKKPTILKHEGETLENIFS